MKMKDVLLALSDAVRRARLEIACYQDPDCRGTADGTVNRLAKILGNDDVSRAMALIDPDVESPSIVPQQNDQRQSVVGH